MKQHFEPDEEFSRTLYEIYLVLFSSRLADHPKQRCLEWASDGKHTWRVVGVSFHALVKICEQRSAEGLKRAHEPGRAVRAAHLFKRDRPLPPEKMLPYFFKHDTTTLVTADENAREGSAHWSKVLAVPAHIFKSTGMSVYASKKVDVPWAQRELERLLPKLDNRTMSWALRYEGELAAEAAEAALRAALPGVELVRKTSTVFAVAALPERSSIPPGWVLYQPAVLDADPPRVPNARTRAAIDAARAGKTKTVDPKDL